MGPDWNEAVFELEPAAPAKEATSDKDAADDEGTPVQDGVASDDAPTGGEA